ncbi:unnamed protein product [Orchesella dallaii]|uniref:Uncharacterized protein n=1 Tax=Orchesella dallaii TaxID=48710 RepID=A0ABP1RY58_9HEXA
MTSLPSNTSTYSSIVTNVNKQTRSSNTNIIVGDDPCSYEKICEVLSKCKSEILWSTLVDISRSLDLPMEFIATIKKNLNVDFQTPRSILYDILENWRAKHTDNAKLINFINVLDSHRLHECGDALRKYFNVANRQLQAVPKPIPQFSNDVLRALNFEISFQGYVIQLHEILQGLPADVVQKIVERFFMQTQRSELLINDSLPKPLPYYIPRRLTTRCNLDPAFFYFECKDVFVIRHIELYELALFAKNHDIDLSTNQLVTLSVRFIVLEYEQDFDRICEISSAPVHLIHHEIGQFTWVKSVGNINNIQNNVHTTQHNLDEQEFTSECLKSSKTICIADSPGMVNLIADEACETEFGCEIIKLLFQAQQQTVHLMFDGFDEVLESQVEITNLVLTTLSLLKSVKLYVSTRPHLKDELENTLAVLGYTIQPFGEKEQHNFLTKFWRQFGKSAIDSKLHEFAVKCIAKLQETMNEFERDIAGIPLQCQLLAEVYKNEAIKYARPDSSVNDQKKIITRAHEYAALKLLFPGYVSKFTRYLIETNQFETRELCAIGILEEADSRTGLVSFAHRTFAEYFLGMFVARMMITLSEYQLYTREGTFMEFLLNKIFRTTATWKSLLHSSITRQSKILESSSFHYPVLCYFVNGHIRTSQTQTIPSGLRTMDVKRRFDMVSACINHDYHELTKLLLQFPTHEVSIYDRFEVTELPKLVFLAAKCTNIDHFKTIYHYALASVVPQSLVITSEPLEFVLTPLHTAAERGHFAIFNFLLNFGLKVTKSSSTKYVVHCCVADSINDDKSTLSQKADIIRLLSRTNREMINENLSNGTSPLLTLNVHVELIKTLLECGADLHAINASGESVFHVCAKHGNHAALTYLLQLPCVSNSQITDEDSNGYTPFLHGMMFGDGLTLEIIIMMEEKGLDITSSLASEALKFLLCNRNIIPSDLNLNLIKTVDYLNSKGGVLLDETGNSPWLMQSIEWNQSRLAEATKCDGMLLNELQNRKIFTHEDKASYLWISEKLYESLRKSRKNKSFEAVCASLIACNQIQPFMMLKQYLRPEAQGSLKCVKLPNGHVEFIESKDRRVVILRSLNVELSVLRLQNTIDPNIPIITDQALERNVSVSKLIICRCETATRLLVKRLAALQVKIICLCTDVKDILEDGPIILDDEIQWNDLSVKNQRELIPQMKIKVAKFYTTNVDRKYSFITRKSWDNKWRICNLSEIINDFSNLKIELLVALIQGYQLELTEFSLVWNPLAGKCSSIPESYCKLSVDNLALKLNLRQQGTDKEFKYYCPVTALRYLLQEQWVNDPLAVELNELTKLVEITSTAGRCLGSLKLMDKGVGTTEASWLQLITNMVHKCVEHLNFKESDWRKLTEVAINTVFPGLIESREMSGMEVFSTIGMVQECLSSNYFHEKILVMFAVGFSGIGIVKFVIDKYVRETGKRVQDISCTQEELDNYSEGPTRWIIRYYSEVDIKDIARASDDESLIALINDN